MTPRPLCATSSANRPLKVYGPGGPYPTIRECAEAFSKKRGVAVSVVKGQPELQAEEVAREADIYYSGAEYMMDGVAPAKPDTPQLLRSG